MFRREKESVAKVVCCSSAFHHHCEVSKPKPEIGENTFEIFLKPFLRDRFNTQQAVCLSIFSDFESFKPNKSSRNDPKQTAVSLRECSKWMFKRILKFFQRLPWNPESGFQTEFRHLNRLKSWIKSDQIVPIRASGPEVLKKLVNCPLAVQKPTQLQSKSLLLAVTKSPT